MAIKFKNNKIDSDTWAGMLIAPGQYYQTELSELHRWQTSDKVLTDLASGDLILNDQISDITLVSQALNILFGVDTEPKDSSGRKIVRQAITDPGNHFELLSIEIRTSNSVVCQNDTGADLGLTSLVRRDVNGVVTQVPADTVMTDVHITFPGMIQAIGALLTQKEPSTSDARFFLTAYPGVLNIPFGKGGVNLALIGIGGTIDADSKAPKDLPAIPGVPTFRIRVIHPAGLDHKFQLHMKIYTP